MKPIKISFDPNENVDTRMCFNDPNARRFALLWSKDHDVEETFWNRCIDVGRSIRENFKLRHRPIISPLDLFLSCQHVNLYKNYLGSSPNPDLVWWQNYFTVTKDGVDTIYEYWEMFRDEIDISYEICIPEPPLTLEEYEEIRVKMETYKELLNDNIFSNVCLRIGWRDDNKYIREFKNQLIDRIRDCALKLNIKDTGQYLYY